MRQAPRLLLLACLVLLIPAAPSYASAIAPPRDLGSLARVSRLVVFAEAQESWSEDQGGMTPFTVTRFRVLQQVKGKPVSGTLEVREHGSAAMTVVGAPRYDRGGRYLLFLDPAPGNRWQSKMLAYGILREDEATGTLRPIAQASELYTVPRPGIEPIGVYRKSELLQHLSAVAKGASPWYREAVEAPELKLATDSESGEPAFVGSALHAAPPACRFVTANGFPTRWFGLETGGAVSVWHTTPGQTGIADGGIGAIQQGAAVWTNHPDSAINIRYEGSRNASFNCSDGSAREPDNEVIFNDPCEEVPDLTALCEGGASTPPHWTSPCCGQVALYAVQASPNPVRQYDGETWKPISGFGVVVNDGAQCIGETDFREVMTHFLGHGLGFEHHQNSNATMYGLLGAHPSRGATIEQTDRMCASYAYHTFLDVPYSRWSWKYVEAIENAGITKGCGGGNYCLSNSASRAEMAVFLVRGTHGADFVPPPATGTVFTDVPATYWAAPFIEQLFADGLTKGCNESPPRYCPDGQVSRAEMAVFLVRIEHGVDFVPPPATGVFDDVATSYWAADHIEQIYNDGVTNGCNANPLRYCPLNNVLREEMAAFLARVFDLPMPQ